MNNYDEGYEEYENNMAMEEEAAMDEAKAAEAEHQAMIENEMTDKKIKCPVCGEPKRNKADICPCEVIAPLNSQRDADNRRNDYE